MKRETVLLPEFVLFAPATPEPGKLYVSMEYTTVLHLCCCGCGNKVITPLAPNKWSLLFDGKGVTRNPSIGNWSFPCQSHYWIRGNAVRWDRQFSEQEIEAVRGVDSAAVETPAALATGTTSWWHRLIASVLR
jgi:hypothetical protein